MSNVKATRATTHLRGPRPKYPCYDCGEFTGSPLQAYRRTDGLPIDWSKGGREGALVMFVHRAGQGCHKSHTDSQVRSGAADVLKAR